MNLSQEQLLTVRAAVKYFMQHHVSIKSSRYKEYEDILQLLNKDTFSDK